MTLVANGRVHTLCDDVGLMTDLMAATVGIIALISRSFWVPKILARRASIMNRTRYGDRSANTILLCYR